MSERAATALALIVALLGTATVLVAALGSGPHAEACAFDPSRPQTYEADGRRQLYLQGLDAASVNRLFPGDAFFGVPPLESGLRGARRDGSHAIPSVLLKAIAWVESDLTMASRSVRFQSVGDTLVSFDCGYGIMQVTTGMTIPLGSENRPSGRQVQIATNYLRNIARGAAILAEKWNQAPELRPIVGTDTGGNPLLLENWYYATWSYNGFTGPGSRHSNHPLDPSFRWPRSGYRCDGTQSRDRYPYQELVWGCMANPPSRDGERLWTSVPASLPDLTQPRFYEPLEPVRFQFPYSRMDIPTPQPAHAANTPTVSGGFAEQALGSPLIEVTATSIRLRANGLPHEGRATVTIRNAGTGILSWQATSAENFLVLSPPAGVAVGRGVSCPDATCPGGQLQVSVNPTLLPQSSTSGTIAISSPDGTRPPILIRVQVDADFELGAPGASRAR